MINKTTRLFPLWAVILSIAACLWPDFFVSFKSAIVPLLAVIMFGMGMVLSWDDFQNVFKKPKAIGLGLFLQFSVMPLAAYVLSKMLGLPLALTTGMVLLGSCPGGTASNVIAYLAVCRAIRSGACYGYVFKYP